MAILSRQDVIDSLLDYLPQITDHIQKLVLCFRSTTDTKDDVSSVNVVDEIQSIQNIMSQLLDSIQIGKLDPKDVDFNIISKYLESMRDLLEGITLMTDWMAEEDAPDSQLKKSVDQLFSAGQKIMNLVEIITEK